VSACDAIFTTTLLATYDATTLTLLTIARRGRHARVHSGALPACAHCARPRGGGRGEHRWPMGAGGTAQRRRRGGKRLPKGPRAANEREGEGCRDCRTGHTSHTRNQDRDRHARGDRDDFSWAGADKHVQAGRQHTACVRACSAGGLVAPRPEGVDCRERSLCTRRPVKLTEDTEWFRILHAQYTRHVYSSTQCECREMHGVGDSLSLSPSPSLKISHLSNKIRYILSSHLSLL
jgi:hypothetical protein